jgi:hypothetical protein
MSGRSCPFPTCSPPASSHRGSSPPAPASAERLTLFAYNLVHRHIHRSRLSQKGPFIFHSISVSAGIQLSLVKMWRHIFNRKLNRRFCFTPAFCYSFCRSSLLIEKSRRPNSRSVCFYFCMCGLSVKVALPGKQKPFTQTSCIVLYVFRSHAVRTSISAACGTSAPVFHNSQCCRFSATNASTVPARYVILPRIQNGGRTVPIFTGCFLTQVRYLHETSLRTRGNLAPFPAAHFITSAHAIMSQISFSCPESGDKKRLTELIAAICEHSKIRAMLLARRETAPSSS